MRAAVQRPLVFAIVGLAVISSRALAQSDSAADVASADRLEASPVVAPEATATNGKEKPEEVTVRGRRSLDRYRVELERARDDIVEIFNEANNDNSTDVTCRNERPTGTRMPQRICRSNADSGAEAAAAKAFLDGLFESAGMFITHLQNPPPGGVQVNALIDTAEAGADGAIGGAAAKAKLKEEMDRLLAENRQLYNAVVKFVDLQEEYNAARDASTGKTSREAGPP
jgi:hypothetical protein